MARCKIQVNDIPERGHSIVFITGVLNILTAKQAWAELEPLLARESVRLIIDLDEMETIDSSGIGALVNFILAIRKHEDARVVFTTPRPVVNHIFEITKLKSFFTIAENHYEAAKLLEN
jgi:anti-sigma B factor antagonist